MPKSKVHAIVTPSVPYVEQLGAMQARLASQPSDEEKSYYRASIDATRARVWGTRHESGSVLDDFLSVASPVFDAIVADRILGYGPLRLAYACETAMQLAQQLKSLDDGMVGAAGTSEARNVTMRNSHQLRRNAKRALRTLAGDRPEARKRAAEAARDNGNPDDRSRSLMALAEELKHAREAVPARIADDAGASAELIEALRVASNAVLGGKENARGERDKVSATYDALNELDGRVLHEMQLLIGAARDARRMDGSIPAVRSRLLRKAKKSPPDVVAPTAATPAPVASPNK